MKLISLSSYYMFYRKCMFNGQMHIQSFLCPMMKYFFNLTEVVMATNDGKLRILRVPEKLPGSLVLPYIELLNEALLTTDNGDDAQAKKHPVAMATGYLDAFQSMIQVRQQVSSVSAN